MRSDGRTANELRPISVTTGVQPFTYGSALIRWGKTHVLCAASVEEGVPPFRRGVGGWLTAEYNMLPGSTPDRKSRRMGGREKEIQRLIGRSLRAVTRLDQLGERTLTVDCDVLSADGGTRVASITGGYIALALAVQRLRAEGKLAAEAAPLAQAVAAVSVGIIDGELRLDLPYEEDSRAGVDMNVVMTADQRFVELQGTAEHQTFDQRELLAMSELASEGIAKLFAIQQTAIQQIGI